MADDWRMGDLAAQDQYTDLPPPDEAGFQPPQSFLDRMGRMTPEEWNAVMGAGNMPWQGGEAPIVGAAKMAMAPGQALQSTWDNPITTEQMIKPAADIALATVGSASPFAAQGGLGMAGGRVKVPEKVAGFAPETKGISTDLFDYSKIHDIPDVPQVDLPRYQPPRGVSERVQDLVSNPKVEQKMQDYIQQGKDINAQTFYYNEPLRQAFVDELGKKKGQTSFARYMDYVAATSPRSDVETNARNASYYYWLEKQGMPVPPQGGVNPQPYGHMAQNLHRENAENIRSGAYFDPIANPKPLSFSQNLQGNFAPVTVDAHAFKLPAMLSRDPEFLAGSIKLEKGEPTINPTQMYEGGDLTMREAAKRPVYWAARPNKNEYGAMENYYKQLAADAGMTPAQTQAAAWAGGGKVTGLGSVAGDPFMRSVENRAIKTAAERGISPAEALSQMMRGKAPLLGVGGTAVMGGLAAQDQYVNE